jgi:hypothetical protein
MGSKKFYAKSDDDPTCLLLALARGFDMCLKCILLHRDVKKDWRIGVC